MCAATIIISKWKRASREYKPAVEAFDDLCKATDPELCSEWKAAADAADNLRDGDATAMDIYDVSAQPCKCVILQHWTI